MVITMTCFLMESFVKSFAWLAWFYVLGRLWLMPLIGSDLKWILRDSPWQISKLILRGSLRRRNWLKPWKLGVWSKLLSIFLLVLCLLALNCVFLSNTQMSRRNGRIALGEENWLLSREEPHSMTSTGSSLCWRRLRFVFIY